MTWRRILCAVILAVCPFRGEAAFERSVIGGRPAGMGGAFVSLSGDLWAATMNPALLTTLDERMVGASVSPGLYGMPELRRGAAAYVEPTTIGTFALSGMRFGFALYHETTLSLAWGMRLPRGLDVGIAFRIHHLGVEGYGSAAALGIDLGARMAVLPALDIGVAIANVNLPSIGASRDRLPVVVAFGFTCTPVRGLTICAGFEKDVLYPASFHAGVEYSPVSTISLRGGVESEPGVYSTGLGLTLGAVDAEYALRGHPVLGMTHEVSLAVRP